MNELKKLSRRLQEENDRETGTEAGAAAVPGDWKLEECGWGVSQEDEGKTEDRRGRGRLKSR